MKKKHDELLNMPIDVWPPPPISSLQSNQQPKHFTRSIVGLLSILLALLGGIIVMYLANNIDIRGIGWYTSMHLAKIIGGIILLLSIATGLIGWRSLSGKIGIILSSILLIATIIAYQRTGS